MTLDSIYNKLHKHYGPQHWWPADTPFEVMVGAVLTQNTAWSNVEKAIASLKAKDCLDAQSIAQLPASQLAQLIRPAGYFNIKAKRLQNFCRWYIEQGGEPVLQQWNDERLRHGLLSVNGVGPETADDIMLYAFDRAVFVVDAYTRRLFSRLGLIDGTEGYEVLRQMFEAYFKKRTPSVNERVTVFNEYHALIVIHAKDYCRKRPLCETCCIGKTCPAENVGHAK